jgi:hypothetical protein
MKKILRIGLSLFIILYSCLFDACKKEKQETTYDLFPLKVGNEFYYKYYKYRFNGISAYTNGTETWKVISESSHGNSNTYSIERKLNATLKVAGQTINISDSVRYFEINEDMSSSLISTSSMILFLEISFKRYHSDSQIEIKQEGYSNMEGWSYLFKSDSGLTKFTYYHPPNQITNESLSLDSLKLVL